MMRNENEQNGPAPKKPTTHQPPHVVLTGISKRYGGVTALDSVDFACSRGSIHAVLGENGAGKSTLIKIMSGVVQPDEGQMSIAGRPAVFPNPASANAAGVVCIFQELSLMQDLSVADNISIADPPRRFGKLRAWLLDGRAKRRQGLDAGRFGRPPSPCVWPVAVAPGRGGLYSGEPEKPAPP